MIALDIPSGYNLKNKPFVDRFWWSVEDVSFLTDEDCWNWIKGKTGKGYGAMVIKGKAYLATRISYHLYKGDLNKNLFVCHKCDNPSCINPGHLYLGTQMENLNSGRITGNKGVNHGMRKLNTREVKEIKQLLKETKLSHPKIAKKFNIYPSLISKIKNKTVWKHL